MTSVALMVVAALLLSVGLGTAMPPGIAPILLLTGGLALLALVGIQVSRGMRRRR
jgi:hypothetical protein